MASFDLQSLHHSCTSSMLRSTPLRIAREDRTCSPVPTALTQRRHANHNLIRYSSWRVAFEPLKCRRSCTARAALTKNPQNVPDPQVLPKPGMSAIEAVEVQLDALQHNDTPWGNHGIQTMYEFGETIGGLDRCYYFGYGKDLYHFDHFMGNFQNAYPELVNLQSYNIRGSKQDEGVHKVLVEVTSQNQKGPTSEFVFILAEKDIGAKKGALMTRCLIRHDPQ